MAVQGQSADPLCDEDEESSFESPYAGGHWEWCYKENKLIFISDQPPMTVSIAFAPAVIIGPAEFKDNLDLIEQLKFRKHMQRKIEGDDDVVTLQDIKDLVLYTAPVYFICPAIISLMHQVTTERFLRALILYCQYYGQVKEEMARRTEELEVRIYTDESRKIEMSFRNNIQDLRLLLTKEYSTMLLGGAEFRKFHHMGKQKTISLSEKNRRLFEALIRLSVEIVWIALGRKWFNIIEFEVNRLFRSDKYNLAEHHLKQNVADELTSTEKEILMGTCVQPTNKLKTNSPLLNEVYCNRQIDFRLLGLGVTKYYDLCPRLTYLENFLVTKESEFKEKKMSLGILGLVRSRFDTMLREVKPPASKRPSLTSFKMSVARISTRSSKTSSDQKLHSNTSTTQPKLYEDIVLPDYDTDIPLPEKFPCEKLPPLSVNRKQYRKWINRANRLANRLSRRHREFLEQQRKAMVHRKSRDANEGFRPSFFNYSPRYSCTSNITSESN